MDKVETNKAEEGCMKRVTARNYVGCTIRDMDSWYRCVWKLLVGGRNYNATTWYTERPQPHVSSWFTHLPFLVRDKFYSTCISLVDHISQASCYLLIFPHFATFLRVPYPLIWCDIIYQKMQFFYRKSCLWEAAIKTKAFFAHAKYHMRHQ